MSQLYGCHNSERHDEYPALAGISVSGMHDRDGDRVAAYKYIKLQDTSSRECRYDLRSNDKKCEGCYK